MSTAALPPLAGATLGALVDSGAALLSAAGVSFGHGTTNAHDEAAWLALWRLGLPLDTSLGDTPDSKQNRPVTQAELAQAAILFEKRIATRKPAAYLTQEAWLQGVPFYVDERSIVPRSLIAELIADGSVDAFLSDTTHAVLDLCTGCGAVAALLAQRRPAAFVVGIDVDPDAVACARSNGVIALVGDLDAPVRAEARFDNRHLLGFRHRSVSLAGRGRRGRHVERGGSDSPRSAHNPSAVGEWCKMGSNRFEPSRAPLAIRPIGGGLLRGALRKDRC